MSGKMASLILSLLNNDAWHVQSYGFSQLVGLCVLMTPATVFTQLEQLTAVVINSLLFMLQLSCLFL
jgi:divalent metal cation (Fe/Co/Zn/Cd) transporter